MKLSPPKRDPTVLDLASLRHGRKGLTPSFGASLAEAAAVCFDANAHNNPAPMHVKGAFELTALVSWAKPTHQEKRCWNDEEVATEQGAYGVAALMVEQCGLEIVERAKKKTGFDYWLGDPTGTGPLFQGLSRLEVSGILRGDQSMLESRVRQKLKQTTVSDGSGLPAVVVVVEFSSPTAKMVER